MTSNTCATDRPDCVSDPTVCVSIRCVLCCVVTTAVEPRDGVRKARGLCWFDVPTAAGADAPTEKYLLMTDAAYVSIQGWNPRTNQITQLIRSGRRTEDWAPFTRSVADSHHFALGLCPDPTDRRAFFACADSAVTRFRWSDDGKTIETKVIAGRRGTYGFDTNPAIFAVGIQFGSGLVTYTKPKPAASGDGLARRMLAIADSHNDRIRSIDIESGQVQTIIISEEAVATGRQFGTNEVQPPGIKGFERPLALAFDRSQYLTPEAAVAAGAPVPTLYVGSSNKITAHNIESGVSTPVPIDSIKFTIEPVDMTSTPHGGILLFTCAKTHRVYSLNPRNGQWSRLAGAGTYGFSDGAIKNGTNDGARFHTPAGLALSTLVRTYQPPSIDYEDFSSSTPAPYEQEETCLHVVDSENRRIRRVTLPLHFFVPQSDVTKF